jgi:UDP-N-acetylmuramate--alanine ligase
MAHLVDFSGKPFHFIGIGGIGMSALAYILAKRQLPVYGSDLRANHITQRLQELGVHIFWNQEASNLEIFRSANVEGEGESMARHSLPSRSVANGSRPSATALESIEECESRSLQARSNLPQVICSSAIDSTNAEYQAALDLGCPIFHRSDLLAALIQDYHSIAVAGTHGKTTTSSTIALVLLQAGLDPTIVVGGEVKAWEGNARLGQGSYLVAEADESDGSLVKFAPHIGVITNIELDHPDRYANVEEVIEIFQTFAQRCQTLVGNADCPIVREQLKPKITYSLDAASGADYTVDRIACGAAGTTARVWERGQELGELQLQVLGQHNLSNALATIAVCRLLNVQFETISSALAAFEGARRRFEQRGFANDILLIDDYAHHPSEIQATLSAARLQARGNPEKPRRVVAIFQPHRYSRAQTFLAEFARSFGDADVVVVSDIYGAGESNVGQIRGEHVAEAISVHHPQVSYQASLAQVTAFLERTLRPRDLAVFLGAGNLNQIIPDLAEFHLNVERQGAG